MDPMNYAFDGAVINLIPRSTTISPSMPAGTYTFHFDQNRGLWLEACDAVPAVTCKVYGDTARRVEKSWAAFKRRTGNTGVLLSGEPGMGKSMFIKLICEKAYAEGIPVILLKSNFPGVTDYLAKITSEVLVVMDEFEKNFRDLNSDSEDNHAQDSFLSLMDGMTDGKKMFIAAVNETWKLNKFMINRPGRFLYHYKFGYLSQQEICEFIEDRVSSPEHRTFLETALLAHDVNYDSLAAICSEINAGMDPQETLDDLNLSEDMTQAYDAVVKINGVDFVYEELTVDLTDTYQDTWYKNDATGYVARIRWNVKDLQVHKVSRYTTELVVPHDQYEIRYFRNREGTDLDVDKEVTSRGDLVLREHHAYGGYKTFGPAQTQDLL